VDAAFSIYVHFSNSFKKKGKRVKYQISIFKVSSVVVQTEINKSIALLPLPL